MEHVRLKIKIMKKVLVVLAMSFIGSSFSQSFMTGGLLTSFRGGNFTLGGNVSLGRKFDYSEFIFLADLNVVQIYTDEKVKDNVKGSDYQLRIAMNVGLGLGYTFNEIYTPYIGVTVTPGGTSAVTLNFEAGMLFTFENFLTGITYDNQFKSLSFKIGFYLPEKY